MYGLKRMLLLLLVLLLVFFAFTRSSPWQKPELDALVLQLNEAAAIGVPHDFLMKAETRIANLALLQKVEQGAVLTEEESQIYRHLFQTVLQQSQSFLARFDGELSVLPDHDMAHANNVSGYGIAGLHDHHDLSARRNFVALQDELRQAEQATNPVSRVLALNAVQKDLVDLISHIGVAAHTVSTPYESPTQPWREVELGELFESYIKHTKQAQFAAIHSPAYWQGVDEALADYTGLIIAVQNRLKAASSPVEMRIAGYFNGFQTLAPPISLHRKLRRN